MKANGFEQITYKGNVIAMIFRKNLAVDGVKFFTDEQNPFQVGAHWRPKGTKLPPHIHVMAHPLVINTIQEVLVVLEGKILVTLYTKEGKVIRRKIIYAGESILLMNEGHGVDFLEDAKIFEVKQGPYPGTTHAKIYLSRGHHDSSK